MAVTKHTSGGKKQQLSGGPSKPQHLSVGEAADLLGIDRSTVCRLAREGRVPFDKVGGQWLTTRRALAKAYPNVVGGGE